jgi:hypothetical protein
MRPLLAIIAAVPLLGACAGGYAYCYDPYRGPVGYYTDPLDEKPACASTTRHAAVFTGPYYGGWRGPYVSGPYYVTPQPVADARP